MSIEIVKFEAPEPGPLKYADDVVALIEAGPESAIKLTATPEDIDKEHRYLSKAANAADRTARFRVEEDNGDGTVSRTFTLSAKRTRNAKPAVESSDSE